MPSPFESRVHAFAASKIEGLKGCLPMAPNCQLLISGEFGRSPFLGQLAAGKGA
jgi:hypothetical protein